VVTPIMFDLGKAPQKTRRRGGLSADCLLYN
jgi:hypothetical protein